MPSACSNGQKEALSGDCVSRYTIPAKHLFSYVLKYTARPLVETVNTV